MKTVLLIMLLANFVVASSYKVDEKESSIKFEANKFLFVSVEGEFKKFKGVVHINQDNSLSKIDAFVEATSIDTKDEERDIHLNAIDYFNTNVFPKINFSSLNINKEKIEAKVTIKDITKKISFKIEKLNITNKELTFELSSKIPIDIFELNGSMSGVISNEITLFANIKASKI